MAENIVIEELLDNAVSVCPLRGKLRVVNKGPPTPPLPSLITPKTKNDLQDIFASLSVKRFTG